MLFFAAVDSRIFNPRTFHPSGAPSGWIFYSLSAMRFLLFLFPSILAASEILTPSSTSLIIGTQFFPADNVSNGSGLSQTPTIDNYLSVTHSAASGSTAWTTNAPGGGSADYFNFGPAPIFVFTFDRIHDFTDLVYWGYHFGNPNGNEGRSFRLEFSSDGGTNFGPSTAVTSPGISTSSSTTLPLGTTISGNAIRLTITDNWFEGFGGGDRVGIGEFRFLGETPINPNPIIAAERLLDFGVNPEATTLSLQVENQGELNDLIVIPSILEGLHFTIPLEQLIIPAGSTINLPVSFQDNGDGCFQDSLTLTTNDSLNPEITITLLAASNCTFPAPGKVNFSDDDGVFSKPFLLTLSSDDDATILYTLDGSIPGEESGLLYNDPIQIDSTTQVRAASYLPGYPPVVRTRSFLKLAPDVASYSSDLPIMVVENFNKGSIPNKGWTTNTQTGGGLQQVERQPAFFSIFERDPVSNSSGFTNAPNQTSRIGIRVRGAFSSTWTPKPYSVETWKTDTNEDRAIKILGMALESDWILYYPHPSYDRTMIYNTFIWELSRQTGRWAPEFRFVDLFVNENGGDLSMANRRGVYVFLEKTKQDNKRLKFDELSEDGSTGGWINSINRMDPIPVEGFPAENGVTTPQFFHTSGPNQLQSTAPNTSGSGDDIPRQYNAFINFEDPNGYRINSAQRSAIEGWFRNFEDVLYDDDIWRDPEIGYRKHVDTTDFIDYMQMLTLAKQGDGLLLSMFPWVSSGDRKLRMGPMWDFNNGAYGGSTTGTLYFRPDRLWYGRLFDDPDFRREYEDRWFELREGPLSNANIAGIIDAQVSEITTDLAVVQSGLSASSWNRRVSTMKLWLQSRANWIDSNFFPPPSFSSEGGVTPDGFQLVISNTTGQSGTIYYSLDGSDPIDSPTSYSTPITPIQSSTISARVLSNSGEWSAIRKANFIVGIPASSANLAISELHYHPAADRPKGEFIELVNISPSETIELTNVTFTAGVSFTFPPETSLGPGERILIVEDRTSFESFPGIGLNIGGEFEGLTKLANSGEQLTLNAADGSVIFDFEFNDKDPWPEFADGEGYSLTLVRPESGPDLSLASHWRCSTTPGGSPGNNDTLTFTGEISKLADFVSANHHPRIGTGSFNFKLKIGADEFEVVPQSSIDLESWHSLPLPTQPVSLNSDESASYQIPLEDIAPAKFMRLLVTRRP